MDNILSIDGYEDGSHEVIDISGTLDIDKKMVKMMIQEQMPWSEKYRPTSIEDIIVDNSVLNRIKQMIKEKYNNNRCAGYWENNNNKMYS